MHLSQVKIKKLFLYLLFFFFFGKKIIQVDIIKQEEVLNKFTALNQLGAFSQ